MRTCFTVFLLCFILTQSFAQPKRKVSAYLSTQYTKTINDATKGNNPWGIGLAIQTFLNTKTRFKPAIELTGDIYLENDKVFRAYADGTAIEDVRAMVNLFLGSSFKLTNNIYLSFLAGPSFLSGQVLLGIKPSFGFYFPKTKRWTGSISYINIFNRDKKTKQNFSSLSLAIGVKLF